MLNIDITDDPAVLISSSQYEDVMCCIGDRRIAAEIEGIGQTFICIKPIRDAKLALENGIGPDSDFHIGKSVALIGQSHCGGA